MGRRILNVALKTMVNAERREKAMVELRPVSNVVSSFLDIMKDRGYVKSFQFHDPHRVGRISVELQGRIKKCKALTYRQDIKAKNIQGRKKNCKALTYRQDIKARDIEQYRLKILPTSQWGYRVITTPDGLLDHEEATRRNMGGQVIGYFH